MSKLSTFQEVVATTILTIRKIGNNRGTITTLPFSPTFSIDMCQFGSFWVHPNQRYAFYCGGDYGNCGYMNIFPQPCCYFYEYTIYSNRDHHHHRHLQRMIGGRLTG